MRFTIANVAYPFAPVGPNAVGGAEHVLSYLDQALVAAGHRSIVVACENSRPCGEWIAVPAGSGEITDDVRASIHQAVCEIVTDLLRREPIDVVHFHGVDFYRYLPPQDVPMLVTLHLPLTWYPSEIFDFKHRSVFLQPVSKSQARAAPSGASLLQPIENGVPVDRLFARHAKRNFAVCLGRICPEKGFHIALDAARHNKTPLLIGGELFNYEAHVQYFNSEIVPRLDNQHRFLGALGFERKRRLLSAARCLLVPSLVAETSSLVAMEALACGTPVIAFPNGALPDIIDHGKTGFLVNDEREMAAALRVVHLLEPAVCRQAARTRFSVQRMTEQYLSLYELLVHQRAESLEVAAIAD